MKHVKSYIVMIGLFIVLLAGCSNDITMDGNEVVVQKQLGTDNKYEIINEISNLEKVGKVKDILSRINWRNGKVDMARLADYRFNFKNSKKQVTKNEKQFEIWITPSDEVIEIVSNSEGKYARLNKSMSTKLFQLLTGKESLKQQNESQ